MLAVLTQTAARPVCWTSVEYVLDAGPLFLGRLHRQTGIREPPKHSLCLLDVFL